ncbi:MAG TPA: sugar phosphate nucleotidyltransferase [Polyangiaceae bacterium]|jgi:NDP-sugar pyrophosphorylase family protein
MQAVVLAGGLATRMRPRTLTVPKSMLELAGRPFVDWQIERLVASGIPDIVMCIAHLGEQIREHVGDGAALGARVVWSEEGPELLGTGGALRMALPLLGDTFLVTYGDSYLPFDYAEPLRMLEAHSDCDGVMAVFKNEGKWDPSNVVIDGAWVNRYEKGVDRAAHPEFDHIDYGATALRRSVLAGPSTSQTAEDAGPGWGANSIGGGGFDAIQRDLASRKRLRAFVARERFFEIGSPEGLAELDRHLRTRPRP